MSTLRKHASAAASALSLGLAVLFGTLAVLILGRIAADLLGLM